MSKIKLENITNKDLVAFSYGVNKDKYRVDKYENSFFCIYKNTRIKKGAYYTKYDNIQKLLSTLKHKINEAKVFKTKKLMEEWLDEIL